MNSVRRLNEGLENGYMGIVISSLTEVFRQDG